MIAVKTNSRILNHASDAIRNNYNIVLIIKIIESKFFDQKSHPNTRIRTKDRPITTLLLQSGALPTELCSEKLFLNHNSPL